MVRLKELFQRVFLSRSDVIPEQVTWALVEAARKLANDTGLLTDVVLFTLAEDAWSVTLADPDGRERRSIERIELWDFDLEQWRQIDPLAKVYLTAGTVAVESLDAAEPYQWTEKDGNILFQSPADDTYSLRAEITWIPTRNPIPDDLPFPSDAEEALIFWAKKLIFDIDGAKMNPKLAAQAEKDYQGELPGLCHLSQDGQVGGRTINDWLPYEG